MPHAASSGQELKVSNCCTRSLVMALVSKNISAKHFSKYIWRLKIELLLEKWLWLARTNALWTIEPVNYWTTGPLLNHCSTALLLCWSVVEYFRVFAPSSPSAFALWTYSTERAIGAHLWLALVKQLLQGHRETRYLAVEFAVAWRGDPVVARRTALMVKWCQLKHSLLTLGTFATEKLDTWKEVAAATYKSRLTRRDDIDRTVTGSHKPVQQQYTSAPLE